MVEFTMSGLVGAVAARVPDRPAIVQGSLRRTYAELVDRSTRLARYLTDRGLRLHRERSGLGGHEAGQDLVAQYLYNCPEYLEGLLGCYRGRLAPFNVNYRYVADELRYLFTDAAPKAVQYHASFAPLLAEILPAVPSVEVLLQVDDGSGHDLLPGAVHYEEALASVEPQVDTVPSPDDLYLLYTGGTTGMPKGVLWRQADAMVALMSLRNRRDGDREWHSVEEKLSAIPPREHRVLPLAPYMHGAAQWGALQTLFDGNTLVIMDEVRTFDAANAVETLARHDVTTFTMVGDAFARPLADELERNPRDLPSVRYLLSGGAALSTVHKERLARAIPSMTIVETMGSSETGVQGRVSGTGPSGGGRPLFVREPTTYVVSEDMTKILEPGHDGTGWVATGGRIPLGYLGDAAKTERTYPVVEGMRLSVPGDRARLLPAEDLLAGSSSGAALVELLGRDAVTINSGGEKIFGEEVEAAVKSHPAVADTIVCGRPSEKWGAEVVALVSLRQGAELSGEALVEHCSNHIARYKLPKMVIFIDEIPRSASGKADYKWAARRASES